MSESDFYAYNYTNGGFEPWAKGLQRIDNATDITIVDAVVSSDFGLFIAGHFKTTIKTKQVTTDVRYLAKIVDGEFVSGTYTSYPCRCELGATTCEPDQEKLLDISSLTYGKYYFISYIRSSYWKGIRSL